MDVGGRAAGAIAEKARMRVFSLMPHPNPLPEGEGAV